MIFICSNIKIIRIDLKRFSAHIEQQTVLQIHEQKVETIQNRNYIKFNAQLFGNSCNENTDKHHQEKYHTNHGQNIEIQAVFASNRTKHIIHGCHINKL